MAENLPIECASAENEINYTTNLVKDGRQYFQSLAHQLAKHVTAKTYDEFRLTAEYGFMDAKIYLEKIVSPGGYFSSAKYGEKKCIGVILYDIDTNRMTLRKTNVDRTVHEFHADGDLDACFGVQYEIFKYLRDSDIIQIHTVERVVRKNVAFIYRITKMKALRNGRFLHHKGHGTQFFIPIEDFKKSEGTPVKKKKATKAKKWAK